MAAGNRTTHGKVTSWVQWLRTGLSPTEVEAELNQLSASERERLEDGHWVWAPGRVLWLDPSRALRRARFTPGTHFCTAKGEFFVDSEGRVHRVTEDRDHA